MEGCPEHLRKYVPMVNASIERFSNRDKDDQRIVNDVMAKKADHWFDHPWSETIQSICDVNEIEITELLVRGRHPAQYNALLETIFEHGEDRNCPHGIRCATWTLIDVMIMTSRMPPWTAGSYAEAHIKDSDVVIKQAGVWRNYRSVMADIDRENQK